MARVRHSYLVFCFFLLIFSWFIVACGIKSYQIEIKRFLAITPEEIEAIPIPEGIKISFRIPSVDQPEEKIVAVKLFYDYIPINNFSWTLSKLQNLTNVRIFDLTNYLEGLEGGYFVYLDSAVPMNSQAFYQLEFINAAGYSSIYSSQVYSFRVTPLFAPIKVHVFNKKKYMFITWQETNKETNGYSLADSIGYLIFRKGPDGERRITVHPIFTSIFLDNNVIEGQNYFYRVVAVRLIQGTELMGTSTTWVSALLHTERKYLSFPSELFSINHYNSIYLRFTPSQLQNTIGYFIERRSNKKALWSRLNLEPWPENTFIDKNVKKGNIYFYRILSMDEAGNFSLPSAIIKVKY